MNLFSIISVFNDLSLIEFLIHSYKSLQSKFLLNYKVVFIFNF